VWIGCHFDWGLDRAWARTERLVSRAVNEQTGLRPVCYEYCLGKLPRATIYMCLIFNSLTWLLGPKWCRTLNQKPDPAKMWQTGVSKGQCLHLKQLHSWAGWNERLYTAVEQYYILDRASTQAGQARLGFDSCSEPWSRLNWTSRDCFAHSRSLQSEICK
jgi:hypothetical protein